MQINEVVTEAVSEALCLDAGEIDGGAALLNDLGAESIDLLDILFRIERKVGVKIKVADLAAYIQGGIADKEFADEQEFVTDKGLAHLQNIMPQVDPENMQGKLPARQIINLFTVGNLSTLVEARQREGA